MKIIFFALTFCLPSWALAMMANPHQPGSVVTLVLASNSLEIIQESIRITPDSAGTTAQLRMDYRVRNARDLPWIPMLVCAWDAYMDEPIGDLKFWWDGEEVEMKQVDQEVNLLGSTRFADFSIHFDSFGYLKIPEGLDEGKYPDYFRSVAFGYLRYSERPITAGEHVGRIEMTILPERDRSGIVSEFEYSLALYPAGYRATPDKLSLTLDAAQSVQNFIPNIGAPHTGNLQSVATWNFKRVLPPEFRINFSPRISRTASYLVQIGPTGFFWAGIVLIVGLHFFFMRASRRRGKDQLLSAWAVVPALVVPILVFLCIWAGVELIEAQIPGEIRGHATGSHLFLILFYPVAMPAYMLLAFFTDVGLRWWYRRKGRISGANNGNN